MFLRLDSKTGILYLQADRGHNDQDVFRRLLEGGYAAGMGFAHPGSNIEHMELQLLKPQEVRKLLHGEKE